MAHDNVPLLAFNRGIVSPLALARTDIKRVALSAEIQTNWVPRVLGSMMLRPGLMYVTETNGGAYAKIIPFEFAIDDQALIELTADTMRVLIDEVPVTRAAVATTIANGNFATTGLVGWNNISSLGGVVTSTYAGAVGLLGNGLVAGAIAQTVSVATADQGVMHALRIIIGTNPNTAQVHTTYGDVHVRVGTAAGGTDLIEDTVLLAGTHSLAFTPGATFTIQISNAKTHSMWLNSVEVEPAGVMTLPTPWGDTYLGILRWAQSADVVFCACAGIPQVRIERRSPHSWSLVNFVCDDGPFQLPNLLPTLTMTPNALDGDTTITVSDPNFASTAVYWGMLLSITSEGQNVASALAANSSFTGYIEVTGLNRTININISGTWAGTLTLQGSVGAPGAWYDITSENGGPTTWTGNVVGPIADNLPNAVMYYRIGFDTGYTSGSATVSMGYPYGNTTGVARIVGAASGGSLLATVLTPFGATAASSNWSLGSWGPGAGGSFYPGAVALYQGRLWWAGSDAIFGSVSDDYTSNAPAYLGDAGPLNRTIGEGMVDVIQWLLPGPLFLMGAEGSEIVCRSDALDSPLTPTNFNLKIVTTHGSAPVPAVQIDQETLFVARSGSKVYNVASDIYATVYSLYNATDISIIAPEVVQPQILRAAVQRNIDTRVHFVKSDGTVALLVFDKGEDVKAWVMVTTDGIIEDVVVIPAPVGTVEDIVYYVVNRTINGVQTRFIERWALEAECIGGTLNKQADCALIYQGAATTTISGLGYLQGQTVVCWADGINQGTFTVSATGDITLPVAVSNAVVGLGYSAQFQSAKLAYAAQAGTALTQRGRVDHLGFILANTHYQGLQYGPDFNTLDELPLMEYEAQTPPNYVWPTYDVDAMEYNDTYNTDSRICLQATAPLPVTVLAAVVSIAKYDKI